MNDLGRAQMLSDMQRMGATKPMDEAPGTVSDAGGFAKMLEQMVESTNAAQKEGAKLSSEFVTGTEQVDLAEVMVAMQKARVHFETMVQVRNRLVRAYEEIIRMPM
jgi:flagellar hook-basal body complex protein FliE